MAFARHKNSSVRAVLELLHLALAIWALTAVLSAFAEDGELASESSTASTGQSPQAGATDDPAPETRFDIWEYRVEGNTLLEAKRIEAVVYPSLGPQRLASDVNDAASNLERAYRDAGFPTIYVEVPEQDIKGGVVTLRIVEGRVGRVRVEGARYFTPSGIRAKLASVNSGDVLHVPTMQDELNALNGQSPDLKVVPILKPGKAPGAVDIDFKVNDKNPLHGSLEANNYNSANTTESRVAASLGYDNLWQKQHSLSLQWQVAPQNTSEVNVLAATYIAPWFDTGNRVAVYAIDSKSDVASVGDTAVIGNGKIYGARFVMPLPSDREYVHSLSMGADYKDYSEIIRLDPANKLKTPIDYAVWSAQYSATQFTANSQTQWSIGANFGIRGVGNSDSEFIDKRNKSYANFAYLRGSVERTDLFTGDWQLISALHAQISDSPLINNEQFSAGGVRSVRGYYESQALGDNGATLSLEVRTPKLIDDIEAIDDLRLLSFFEA
ncbi:MAG TPA: ShlB/FhaC/HecB family hemolysin secretion/activation protein, partial [Spongiibacteraceae bacterium]|nr:ShlB/FhaC/HecB family hemolysin secretion/activation protein [Spongiibacteraceae bacterium]